MRKLFVHIGCGKTGSSALQVWLMRNQKKLEKTGVVYPSFGTNEIDTYQITSGNGVHLYKALEKKNAFLLINNLLNTHDGNLLFSSEIFQKLNVEQASHLKSIAKELSLELVIIAFVRDVYDIAYSGYLQLLKRNGFTKSFREHAKLQTTLQQFSVIKFYENHFDCLKLVHYDTEKKIGIEKTFCNIIGVDSSKLLEMASAKVNRSLTNFESQLIRFMNQEVSLTFGSFVSEFSTLVSDFIIQSNPEIETEILFYKDVLSHFEFTFSSLVKSINDKYFGENVLKIFSFEGKKIIYEEVTIDNAYYNLLKSVIQTFHEIQDKLLTSKISSENRKIDKNDPAVMDLLNNEARIKESTSLNQAYILMSAAKIFRPNASVIDAKLTEYAERLRLESIDNKTSFKELLSITGEIETLGLKKGGKGFNQNMLQPGWHPIVYITTTHKSWGILLLEYQDDKDAIWVFDENKNFVRNNIEFLGQDKAKLLKLSHLIIRSFLLTVYNSNFIDISIIKAFQRKSFFYNQMFHLIRSFAISSIENVKFKNYHEILENHGRIYQDEYLKRNNKDKILSYYIDNVEYIINHSILVNDFLAAYFLISKDNELIVLFESGQYNCRAFLYSPNEELFLVKNKTLEYLRIQQFELFLIHFINNYKKLLTYFSKPIKKMAGLIRNSHLGHSLWNDLTALYRIESNNLLNNLDELIIFRGQHTEPWGKVEDLIRIPNNKINRSIRKNQELVDYIIEKRFFIVRLGDNYIPNILSNRIIKYSNKHSPVIDIKTNRLRVVIGLRFENRTWINQTEGIVSLCKYIAKKKEDVTFIIDGHDYNQRINGIQMSHQEKKDFNVVDLEKKVIERLHIEKFGPNVEIIDAVAINLEETIRLINSADFFIAPWGAGLAKYKWICNKPGILFTSNWNINNKKDLKIYESPNFRENATNCVYVESRYIKDISSPMVVNVKGAEDPRFRNNFHVDIYGLYKAIDEIMENLKLEEIV